MNAGGNEKWEHVEAIEVKIRSEVDSSLHNFVAQVTNSPYVNFIACLGRDEANFLGIKDTESGRYYDGSISESFNGVTANIEITYRDTKVVGRALISDKESECFVFVDFLNEIPEEDIPNNSGEHLIDKEINSDIIALMRKNKYPLQYVSSTIMTLIPEERELLRGNNEISQELKNKVSGSLDEIEKLLLQLTSNLMSTHAQNTEIENKKLELWTAQFRGGS